MVTANDAASGHVLFPLSYADVRGEIRDGDLLLFRRRGLIAAGGRGIHSHAAKAAWWGDDLFLLETLHAAGGRAVTLSSQIERWPGRWDWYAVNPHDRWSQYDRAGSTDRMKRLCGCEYGFRSLLYAAMIHLPLVRRFIDPQREATTSKYPPFCSHACALADRLGGGVDPVPQLADRLTEPADLARSPFYEYRGTLC